MCYLWPDYAAAEETINMFKQMYLPDEPIDVPKEVFKQRSDQVWAVNDLLEYLRENWGENYPSELICDYIDDARYRARKYKESFLGPVYETAKQTAENILHYFITEV